MSLCHEDLTPEELSHQKGLDRSWVAAQGALANPAFRSYLERSIERVNQSVAATLSADEFLTQTESSIE